MAGCQKNLRMLFKRILIGVLIWFGCLRANCQSPSIDSISDKLVNFPSKLFSRLQNKTAGLQQQLTRQSEKYARKMASREARLQKKLSGFNCSGHHSSSRDSLKCIADSTAAGKLFAGEPVKRYAVLLQKLKTDSSTALRAASGPYAAYADSTQGVLAYLNKNPQLLNSAKFSPADIQSSLSRISQLQGKLQDADVLQQFMQQRKTQIQQYLAQYEHLPSGVTGIVDEYNKQLYYYGQQVKAYKDMLDDPDKLMGTALQLLDKLPSFNTFMRSNSFLSGLLNMPGATGSGATAAAGQTVQGLQTRAQVMAAIQTQVGVSGPNPESFVQQNVGSAQSQLDQLRDKLSGTGGNGGSLDMPEFKPNNQKTKSFLQRLEFGANLHTAHGNYYFPTTTDLGLSLGYKLSDGNSVGLGASYKIGWGTDFDHIHVTSQGVGLRTYLDIHIKKSFYASGGFEYNYQQPFYSADIFHDISNWQQSGLIGISKIISLKTKVFKQTKFQLLWDFLSYQQVPKAQPLVFRVGYTF
jgi:hypothetical protein